jgi:hypothetical protein
MAASGAKPAEKQANTGLPALAGAPVDLAAFRAHVRAGRDVASVLPCEPDDPIACVAQARAEVLACLTSGVSKSGSTALVLDPSLSGPLSLVAEVRGFREHGIEKIYHLLPEPLQTTCTTIVYCIRPQLRLAAQLAAQVRGLEKARGRGDPVRNYVLCFVPRRSIICEKVLADEGVLEQLSIIEVSTQRRAHPRRPLPRARPRACAWRVPRAVLIVRLAACLRAAAAPVPGA